MSTCLYLQCFDTVGWTTESYIWPVENPALAIRKVLDPLQAYRTEPGLKSNLRKIVVKQKHWTSCLHTCASVTKQYILVSANGRLRSPAGEVTAEFMASVTCGLTAEDRDKLRNPTRSFPVCDYLTYRQKPVCYTGCCFLCLLTANEVLN